MTITSTSCVHKVISKVLDVSIFKKEMHVANYKIQKNISFRVNLYHNRENKNEIHGSLEFHHLFAEALYKYI